MRKGNLRGFGKESDTIEDLFYLSRINAKKKLLIFQDDRNDKGQSYAETFVENHKGILDDAKI